MLFEKEPPEHSPPDDMGRIKEGQANDTALIIPCYKSEKLIAATLEAALKTFPARNIFVSGLWYVVNRIKLIAHGTRSLRMATHQHRWITLLQSVTVTVFLILGLR